MSGKQPESLPPAQPSKGQPAQQASEGEWHSPFMAPALQRALVGRDALLRQLKCALFQHGKCPTIVLTQLPGVGKTALAIQLANDIEVKEHFLDGILWAPLGKTPDVRSLLGEWLLALGFSTREVSDLQSIEERKAAAAKKIGDRRMLLVLDVAWDIDSALAFLLGGRNCAHLMTTRFSNVALGLPGAEIFTVPELSPEDGLALLEQLAPRAVKADPIRAADLVQTVGGLPLALVLMGKYLWKESLSGQPRRIQDALARLKDVEKRLRLDQAASALEGVSPSLVSSIQVSEEILEDQPRRALHALSILQPKPWAFTAEAAMAVAEASTEDLEALVDTGLLEIVPGKGFWMSRTISDYSLSQLDPAMKEALHGAAANYYMNKLRLYEETRFGDATPYQRRYAYENPDWQAFKVPSTFHLAQLQDRTEANLIFAEVFFDTFWWWRCYNEKFPFNDLLLAVWRENAQSRTDRRWLEQVELFLLSYPTGYLHQGGGDWAEVESSLLSIRQLGEMEGDIFQLDLRRRHVRAITNMFLAESYRYRSVEDHRADQYYQESLSVFSRSGEDREREDSWNLPWVLWHLSDLALARGQFHEARTLTQKARNEVFQSTADRCMRDNEIVANSYRVDADCWWHEGDTSQALRDYARAVYYAYIFNACPMQLPDFYTAEFYAEMTSRLLERICSLADRGQSDEAERWIRFLIAFWAPYWELSGSTVDFAQAVEALSSESQSSVLAFIAPRAPAVQDMTDPTAEYAGLVQQVVARMGNRIDQE